MMILVVRKLHLTGQQRWQWYRGWTMSVKLEVAAYHKSACDIRR